MKLWERQRKRTCNYRILSVRGFLGVYSLDISTCNIAKFSLFFHSSNSSNILHVINKNIHQNTVLILAFLCLLIYTNSSLFIRSYSNSFTKTGSHSLVLALEAKVKLHYLIAMSFTSTLIFTIYSCISGSSLPRTYNFVYDGYSG